MHAGWSFASGAVTPRCYRAGWGGGNQAERRAACERVGARGGGSHAEFIAGLLDRMTADAETIDWWERATPRPRQ